MIAQQHRHYKREPDDAGARSSRWRSSQLVEIARALSMRSRHHHYGRVRLGT